MDSVLQMNWITFYSSTQICMIFCPPRLPGSKTLKSYFPPINLGYFSCHLLQVCFPEYHKAQSLSLNFNLFLYPQRAHQCWNIVMTIWKLDLLCYTIIMHDIYNIPSFKYKFSLWKALAYVDLHLNIFFGSFGLCIHKS